MLRRSNKAPRFSGSLPPGAKKKDRLDTVKDCVGIFQSLAIITALIAGALWFIESGEDLARANISVLASHQAVSSEAIFLHVTVTLTNNGKRPVTFQYLKTRVQ